MVAKLALILAVVGLSGVQAQKAFDCNGYLEPYWPACDSLMELHEFAVPGGPDEPSVAGQTCLRIFNPIAEGPQEGNCVIHFCNSYDDGQTRPLQRLPTETNYRLVKQMCGARNSGGQAPGYRGNWITAVTNDADDFEFKKRAAGTGAVGVTSMIVTMDEFEDFLERAANATIAHDENAKASGLQKRQGTWTTFGSYRNIRRSGYRDLVAGPLSPGVEETVSNSEGYSTTIGVNAEVGASFFEIFSASIGVEVSTETSVQHTFSRSFVPADQCASGQRAMLYFYPLWDHYVGSFSDVEGTIDVWIPLDTPTPDLDIECLG